MSRKRGLIFVILPAGTKLTSGSWDGAPSFTLPQAAVAFFPDDWVWEDSFGVHSLEDDEGKTVATGLKFNYVLNRLADFTSGETAKEAWANFRAGQGKK